MATRLSSLRSSSAALDALQRGIAVSQNNVTNASTPGYARQRMVLAAAEFDLDSGLAGGVKEIGVNSSRDVFAETGVRREISLQADAQQDATQLAWIESAVDLNDAAGIASSMDRLFKSFQSWSVSPNSHSEKENVLAAAGDLAVAFNRTADSLNRISAEAEEQINETVDAVNTLAARIRTYNEDRRNGRQSDAGVEARIYTALEELSELVNVQAIWHQDGTVTVLAAGEAPLVVGDRAYRLEAKFIETNPDPDFVGAVPPTTIRDATGADVTGVLRSGKLGALIRLRNETLPGYLGSSTQQGDLNRLAQSFADRVNAIFADGRPVPASDHHIFVHEGNPVSIAHKLRLKDGLTAGALNPSDPSSTPAVVNGKPLRLAALARPNNDDDRLDGLSYISWFGKMSAQAGREVQEAREEADSRSLMATQARGLRDRLSGVSLDEEAVRLVEYQRAYQANARIVTVLDEMMQITVNLGR